MQVEGLSLMRRNRVDVNSHKSRRQGFKDRPGFFSDLTPRGVCSTVILQLYMTARKQPAIEPSMMHQQNTAAICA